VLILRGRLSGRGGSAPAFPEDLDGEKQEEGGYCEGEYAWGLLPKPFCSVGLSVSNIGATLTFRISKTFGRRGQGSSRNE
jgi:hypothetical protein